MSLFARCLKAPIRWYQQARSGRPSPCRFEPSCSSYALEAIDVHGPARGSWLALCRIGRCRPGARFGWDPVPLRLSGTSSDHHNHERKVA